MRGDLLARHWLTGMMLGIHNVDAWPNTELVRLLLPAIEQHADVITLGWELDRIRPGPDEP